MWRRTTNPNLSSAHRYVKRGIIVEDPRWKSFETFLADIGECPAGKTLDRINNDLGYFKENCRWATKREQDESRSTTKLSYALAIEIALRYFRSKSARSIAKDYAIHHGTVTKIAKGRRWRGACLDAALNLSIDGD
jgi:hypothetical protein